MDWQMKRKPEDFIVREMINDRIEASWLEKTRLIHGKGTAKAGNTDKKYLWFTLKKTNMDFFDTIGMLAKDLGISSRSIGYSGTKDRRAVTYQTISVPSEKENAVRNLRINGLEVSDFRHRNRPVNLGEHDSNMFSVTVRNIEKKEIGGISKEIARLEKEGMINFFGRQRFGTAGMNHVC